LNGNFDQIYNMYSPSVYDVADIIDTYVYRIGIGEGRFSLSTALGLFKSVIGTILIVISNFVVKKLGGRLIW
ncbi:MAG: sugar ABC transporter permease, partial [Christensenellales bacterium]